MRSACTSTFHFFRDAPATETRVRWYRVPPDRPALGLDTVFGSSIWDDTKEPVALGEVGTSRQWWQGGPPVLFPVAKVGRCGTADQWDNGCRLTDPLPPVDPNTGQPRCCGLLAIIGVGGIAEGAFDIKGELADADGMQANVCFDTFQQVGEADGMNAQVCWHAWQEVGEGDALEAPVVAPLVTTAEGPEADALSALVFPPTWSAEGPEADALTALVVPGTSSPDLPEADALGATVVPDKSTASLPEADALDATVVPDASTAGLPEADALTATVESGGGTVAPGVDCDHAADVTLPFNQSGTIAPGSQQWWKFAGVAGHTYRIQLSAVSGGAPSASLLTGTCAALSNRATCLSPFFACADFTLGFSGTVYIQVVADFFSGVNYTIAVADGAC